MLIQVDPQKGPPVYEQIAQQVTFAVANGALLPGEIIPSVRQMARELAVNPNTVARAYRLLQDEGIVQTIRGTGLQICQKAVNKCVSTRRKEIQRQVDSVIQMARRSEMADDEFLQLVQTELQRPPRPRGNKS